MYRLGMDFSLILYIIRKASQKEHIELFSKTATLPSAALTRSRQGEPKIRVLCSPKFISRNNNPSKKKLLGISKWQWRSRISLQVPPNRPFQRWIKHWFIKNQSPTFLGILIIYCTTNFFLRNIGRSVNTFIYSTTS